MKFWYGQSYGWWKITGYIDFNYYLNCLVKLYPPIIRNLNQLHLERKVSFSEMYSVFYLLTSSQNLKRLSSWKLKTNWEVKDLMCVSSIMLLNRSNLARPSLVFFDWVDTFKHNHILCCIQSLMEIFVRKEFHLQYFV